MCVRPAVGGKGEPKKFLSREPLKSTAKDTITLKLNIIKQMNLFVPVYVACGGEELDGVDYVLATKIFRKFEALNLAMLRDELKEL